MRSILIVGALAWFGSGLAYAQQPQTATQQSASAPTAEDIAAISDARVAAVKDGLKLKPDQEKAWASFEGTLRDISKQRQERVKKFIDAAKAAVGQTPDPIAMMRLRADAMNQASAELKRFADAMEPLYKSLDDGQKRRMLVLVASVGPR